MNFKDLFQPFKSRLNNKARIVSSVFSLGSPQRLLIVFFRWVPLVIALSTGKTRVLPRCRHAAKFVHHIVMMNVEHGPLYVVKYMKACHVAIQLCISGHPVRSLQVIEPGYPFPRLKRGLPQFIGSMDRHQISQGNPHTVRMWLSILNLYRVLDAPRKVKLETITNPYSGSWAQIGSLKSNFRKTSRLVLNKFGSSFRLENLRAEKLRFSTASGPNAQYAFTGPLVDAIAYTRYPDLMKSWQDFARITGSTELATLFNRCVSLLSWALSKDNDLAMKIRRGILNISDTSGFIIGNYPDVFDGYSEVVSPTKKVVTKLTHSGCAHDCELGKLVGIPEPAGKMRVIALVDIWTQSLFDPLHKSLFSFLRKLPNDGTFDQNAAFERAVRKGLDSTSGTYCADLSSATDRLPLILQEDIINRLYGHGLGSLWAHLLSAREFILREPLGENPAGTRVTYGAGQPMGCLSSWAMLAVCHHFILQACNLNLGRSSVIWHTNYEILGDDIVIFDRDLYHEYLRVMSLLDVATNPSKSLVSDKENKVLEFAKRTALNGVEVSGLSWKQLIQTTGIKDLVPLILSYSDKGLIPRVGVLVSLINSFITPRRGAKILTKSSKSYKTFVNVLVSLLNHNANIGFMSLASAFRYVVDTRKSKLTGTERFTSCDVPVTTLLHDLIVCIKALPFFRMTGTFDASLLRLNKLELRDYLVGANIRPFWGHGLDRALIIKMNVFSEILPILPSTILGYILDGTFKLPADRNSFTPEQEEIAVLMFDLVDSMLDCRNDQEKFNSLKHTEFADSLAVRDFERSQRVHKEFDLFLTKYDFIETLGNRSLKARDLVIWPMADVRLSQEHGRAFDYITTRPDRPSDFPLTFSPWQVAYVQHDKRLRRWLGYTGPRGNGGNAQV